MKITKTSEQAREEEKLKQEAYLQTLCCPECGQATRVLDRVPLMITGSSKHIYKCSCRNCGCEWETDNW